MTPSREELIRQGEELAKDHEHQASLYKTGSEVDFANREYHLGQVKLLRSLIALIPKEGEVAAKQHAPTPAASDSGG